MIPTTENIAIAAWRRLEPAVHAAGGAQLSRVRVYETPEIFAEYRGEAMKAYFGRRYVLSASHRLHADALTDEENRAAYGKCNNPHGHGHNYVVEVLVGGAVNAETGMVIDLAALDEVVRQKCWSASIIAI